MQQMRANLAGACAMLMVVFAAGVACAGVIRIDGSSTVYPITNAAAAAFLRGTAGAHSVTVGISGTGGGFRKFCRGEIDIQDASRPVLKREMAECRAAGIEYVELPVAFDAITVAVNPRNTFAHSISVEELRRIWEPSAEGAVKRWKQVNAAWPDEPIKIYAPGRDSGTFDYFTEAIVGTAQASRRDFHGSEDDNVLVQGVARDVNALGYFGFAYYKENSSRLRALAVAEGGRPAVAPSLQTVINGTYRPLSRPIFIYVSVKATEKPDVREFIEFYLRNGARFAKEARYVALPDHAYATVLQRFKSLRKGTVFGGATAIGITIEELLEREARF